MKFTVEILTGMGNVLKALISALSIAETNILPRLDFHADGDYAKILDDSLICHGDDEFGTNSFVTARWLILKEEELEQPDLINDTKVWGDHPNIEDKSLAHLFSTHTIDWFFDRNLISDKVYERIQNGIKKIKWTDRVLSEVEKISSHFEGPLLSVQIRTWGHSGDPANCINIQDGVPRKYSFEEYKNAINKFLPEVKTIFITSDNDSILPEYIDYLKDWAASSKSHAHNVKVVTYPRPANLTLLQHSAASMLLGSKSDMLVCNRISTFAECMWWFGECKATTIPVG
tara:strand:- start:2731 stop:3591 length:861 start_codon:yes stop_codon:yes gene_type:complete